MLIRKSVAALLLVIVASLPALSTLSTGEGPAPTAEEILLIPKVHAGPVGANSTAQPALQTLTKALEVLVIINWLALSIVENLLDPDMIFGKEIGGVRTIEPLLRNMWVMSRNIANAIFGFLLLIGGILVVFKGGGEEGLGMIKKLAPRFVLAVILVNFSWFFPRVIFDASNILSSVVYQLPLYVDANFHAKCYYHPGDDGVINTGDANEEPCLYVWKVRFDPPDCSGPFPGCPRPEPTAAIPNKGKRIANFLDIYYMNWNDARLNGKCDDNATNPCDAANRIPISGANAVINGFATNFAKMPLLASINFAQLQAGVAAAPGPFQQAQEALKFLVHVAFQVIVSGAIGLTLAAFAGVLVVRMGVLWLCIAFMPFVFIGFAMGKPIGDTGDESIPNIWKKYITYTLIPFFVSIPYSIGFLMISQLYYFDSLPVTMDFLNVGKIVVGATTMQQLLWMIMTIAILWIGTFSALEKDKLAAGVTGFFKGLGQTGMKIAGHGIAFGPGFPMPGGKKMSLGAAYTMFKQTPNLIVSQGLRDAGFGGGAAGAGGAGGGGGGPLTPAHESGIRKSVDSIKLNPNSIRDFENALSRVATAFETGNNIDGELMNLGNYLNRHGANFGLDARSNRDYLNRVLTVSGNQLGPGIAAQVQRINAQSAKLDQHYQAQGGGGGAPGGGGANRVQFGDATYSLNINDARSKDATGILNEIKAGANADSNLQTGDVNAGLQKLEQSLRGLGDQAKADQMQALRSALDKHRADDSLTAQQLKDALQADNNLHGLNVNHIQQLLDIKGITNGR